jgi:hypothetical protein
LAAVDAAEFLGTYANPLGSDEVGTIADDPGVMLEDLESSEAVDPDVDDMQL